MKAYPLIYSRTKNCDFVPDFLVRPKNFDYQMALKYVKNAINNLDFLQNIRYTAFSVGEYCVCGGIACISKKLFDKLMTVSPEFTERYPDADTYLKDCKGRNIACFIGIAIPRTEVKTDTIPNISLEEYWEIYLQYLKHQWDSESNTVSEQLDSPLLEIKEKRYIESLSLQRERFGERYVIKNYERNEQQILDYFFHAILNGSGDSFITEIDKREEWNTLNFNSVVVSDSLYFALKNSGDNPMGVSIPNSGVQVNKTDKVHKSGEIEIKRTAVPIESLPTAEKKTSYPVIIPVIMILLGMMVFWVIFRIIR